MSDIIWKGSPNHYVGRNGYGVTHITLHIMVGYLAGTDATFASQSSRASAHYGIGATGEIHQYVSELDGSYSDANYESNNSTISIEHEGGMANGAVCTQECIDASARLCADIARRQCLAAPGDPRHRPPLMPRPRAQRPAIQADHRQSKSDTRGRNHVKRRR